MINDFLLDISRYFRDFLDTDFKRQRLPKRHITCRDATGDLVSLSLGKYPALLQEIWTLLATPLSDNIQFTVTRGSFQTQSNDDIKDCFDELFDLSHTIKMRENLALYLYIGEVHYHDTSYPMLYIPLQLTQVNHALTLNIDPRLYVNKKALDYVAQDINRTAVAAHRQYIPISDRIVYLDQSQKFISYIQMLINDWSTQLELNPLLDLSLLQEQQAQSTTMTVTNRLYFAVSDKADESLLNDYEDLLNLADKNDPVFNDFTNIVQGFLYDDPVPVSPEVERAWEASPIEARLVYRSPIPLNEEQRKILSAVQQEGCRFVTVQGPPGTGKSHTITALAFEALLAQKNILILSDKTEALDTVEHQLEQTLNQVRHARDFPNPILRLGRASNTYRRILSTQSMERLRRYHRNAMVDDIQLQHDLNNEEKNLQNNLKQLTEAYEAIDIHVIMDFHRMDALVAQDTTGLAAHLTHEPTMRVMQAVQRVTAFLQDNDNRILNLLKSTPATTPPSLDDLANLLAMQSLIATIRMRFPAQFTELLFFSSFNADQVDGLATFIRRYEMEQWPLFGFMFKQTRAREIDQACSEQLSCQASLNTHQNLSVLHRAYNVLSVLRQQLQRQFHHTQFFELAFQQLMREVVISSADREQIGSAIQTVQRELHQAKVGHAEGSDAAGLTFDNIEAWVSWTQANQASLHVILNYHRTFQDLQQHFDTLPPFDYHAQKSQLERLHTQMLANLMDGRVLDFYEHKRTTSHSIREIICNKQRFSKNKFRELQQAFPCIIASIRDYAEYVPLQAQLFDLVIIDEASQVSIAQALPALLRAKQMVVLGDHKQFANTKTISASADINEQYTSKIISDFVKQHAPDSEVLNRLKKFDIKTSVLEFVDMLANHGTMLKKHFRGYPELINFASQTFYYDQLQAIKVRTQPIDEVLAFTILAPKPQDKAQGNINIAEAEYIAQQLEPLLHLESPPTVGVITPFTDQQHYLSRLLLNAENGTQLFDRLQLKVMTFDSCQGDERDIIFYSMVATPANNQLYAVFPKSLGEAGKVKQLLRMQRLNVGLSRAKEKMHFVLSQSVDQFKGAIGEVLAHYQQVIIDAKGRFGIDCIKPMTTVENKLLAWVKQTAFYQQHSAQINCIPRFPMADYLCQLDHQYRHPVYRFALLLKIKIGGKYAHFIVEYDGFTEYLSSLDNKPAKHYRHYYNTIDIEREKILESYGYQMLRVNRFNLGVDPITTLSNLLAQRFAALMFAQESFVTNLPSLSNPKSAVTTN